MFSKIKMYIRHYFRRLMIALGLASYTMTPKGACFYEYCKSIASGESPARIDAYEKDIEKLIEKVPSLKEIAGENGNARELACAIAMSVFNDVCK